MKYWFCNTCKITVQVTDNHIVDPRCPTCETQMVEGTGNEKPHSAHWKCPNCGQGADCVSDTYIVPRCNHCKIDMIPRDAKAPDWTFLPPGVEPQEQWSPDAIRAAVKAHLLIHICPLCHSVDTTPSDQCHRKVCTGDGKKLHPAVRKILMKAAFPVDLPPRPFEPYDVLGEFLMVHAYASEKKLYCAKCCAPLGHRKISCGACGHVFDKEM